MLSPMRWLLRSMKSLSKSRRQVKRPALSIVEDLEQRQLLTTIFSENFDGAFPNAWTIVSSQGRKWDDDATFGHSGSFSGFCADLTNETDQTSYVNNMNTTMTRTVDLSDYREVELDYWRMLNTEADFDKFQVTVSKAGVGSVTSPVLSGNHMTWTEDTLQIPESLWGQSGVTVEFKFTSDINTIPAGKAGVWVDDIVMSGTNDPGFPESKISVPQGINLQLNQLGEIANYAGTIVSATDIETYGFGVDATGSYTVSVSGPLDAELRIYDAQGNAISPLIDQQFGGVTETYTFNLNQSAVGCYIQVAGYQGGTGSFTLSVSGPTSFLNSESLPSPTYSTTQNDSIDYAGDRDYFTFVAPLDTTTANISLTTAATMDGVLNIFDSSGNLLSHQDGGNAGVAEHINNFAVTPGQAYVVMVSSYNMSQGYSSQLNYSLTIDLGPDNVGDPPSKITVPDGTNLRLNQFGDVDGVTGSINSTLDYRVYGFGVETTGSHTITVTGAVDAQLRIYDSNGNAITAIRDFQGSNGTETLSVNLTAGQTCYFVVGGFGTATGNFSVAVNGPSASPTPVVLSAPNFFLADSSSISGAGDRDYLSFTVPAGTNLLNVIMNPSATLDGVFALFDSAGNMLQFRDNANTGGAENLTNLPVTPGQNLVLMFTGYNMSEGSSGAENYSYSIDFAPDQNDVNVAPTIPSGQQLFIAENSSAGTQVGTVIANDANSSAPNNVLTYSIVSGSPSNPFSINANTGLITYVGPGSLNYEANAQFNLTVKVTDGGNLSATQQVTVLVTDVNEAPSVTLNQTFQIAEDADFDASVGTVLATDPDTQAPNNTLTYSFVNPPSNNPFAIDPATGLITVTNPTALDYETTSQYNLQVKATDGGNGNLSSTQTVTINLIDVNDAPEIDLGQAFTVPENSVQGTSVGTVQAQDADGSAPNNVLTFSITGGNDLGAFAINPATGEISVANPAGLDYETTPVFVLNVTVTDGGGLSTDRDVTVNLTNVNEAPIVGGAPVNGLSFVKKSAAVTVFPSITVKDPDGDTELAQVTVSVTLPAGKKNFDVVGFGGASGLGSVSDTVVNGKRQLVIVLNAGVTSSQVENFLRGITFSTSKAGLKSATRTFQVSVTDIHGATSNLITQTVNVKKKA